MKTIVHLSDLHFGKVDKKRLRPLIEKVNEAKPDLVIVSGDITQNSLDIEYKEAKEFLSQIKAKLFIIPGNHDIPQYNLLARLIRPFKKYKEFISENLSPIHTDDEISVIGINSVRPHKISSGHISKKQIETIQKSFSNLESSMVKILVSHHPFDLSHVETHHKHTHKVIGGSKVAMKRLAKQSVDIYLSGHLHVTHIGDTTVRYKIKGYSGLILGAGTAISKRLRGKPVSFNILNVASSEIIVQSYAGEDKSEGFALASTSKFQKGENGWKAVK